jgi:hypothetical protein
MAASVGGEHHSLSATLLLGVLALVLGHSLIEEIKRQARRASAGWTRKDTTNAVLLGLWTELALAVSILLLDTVPTRAVGLALAASYAAACGYFVTERRRAIATVAAEAEPAVEAASPAGTVPLHRHPGHVEPAPLAATDEIRSAGPR